MILNSCQKEEDKGDTFSMSIQVNSVTSNSMNCIVSVTVDPNYKGGWFVGCMLGENDFPTTNENSGLLTMPIVNSGQYSISITNLKPNTKYYIEGFVTNGTPYGKTIYYDGDVIPVITPAGAPGLQIVSLRVGDLYQNQTGYFSATVKNNGTGVYNSRLWVYLTNSNTGAYQFLGGDIYSIAVGESSIMVINGTITLPADTYDCNMVFDANNDPSNPDYYQFYNTLGVKATVK